MSSSNNKSALNHSLQHITSGSSPIPITDNVIPSYSITKDYDLPGLLDKKTYEELEDAGKWTSGTGSYSSDIYFNTGNVGIGTTQPGEKLHVVGAIIIGDNEINPPPVGTIRYNNGNFQGYKSGNWVNLDVVQGTNTNVYLSQVAIDGNNLKFTRSGTDSPDPVYFSLNGATSPFLGTSAVTAAKGDHDHDGTYLTTSHLDLALQHTELGVNPVVGLLKRSAAGAYSIDDEDYLTEIPTGYLTDDDFVNPPDPDIGFMRRVGTNSYEVDDSTYLTDLGSALVDGDFDTAGLMKTDGSGGYTTVNPATFATAAQVANSLVHTPFLNSSGFMKTNGSSGYSVDTETYLTTSNIPDDYLLKDDFTGTQDGLLKRDTASGTGYSIDNTQYLTEETFDADDHGTHVALVEGSGPDTAARSNHAHSGYTTDAELANYMTTAQHTAAGGSGTHLTLAGDGSSSFAARSDHLHDGTYITQANLATYMTTSEHTAITPGHLSLAGTGSSTTHAAKSNHDHSSLAAHEYLASVPTDYMKDDEHPAGYHCDSAYTNTTIQNLLTTTLLNTRVATDPTILTQHQGSLTIDSDKITNLDDYVITEDFTGADHLALGTYHCDKAYDDDGIRDAITAAHINDLNIDAATVNNLTVGTAVPVNAIFTDKFPTGFTFTSNNLGLAGLGSFSPVNLSSLANPDGVVTGVDYDSSTKTIKVTTTLNSVATVHESGQFNECPAFSGGSSNNYLHQNGQFKQVTYSELGGVPTTAISHTHTASDIVIGTQGSVWADVYGETVGEFLHNTASDIRYKENIINVEENYLDTIGDIKVFRYDWNSWMVNNLMVKNIYDRSNFGISAQDLEEKIPEVVREMVSDIKGINIGGMFAYMVKLIQELKKKNEGSEDKVKLITDQLGLTI